MKLPRVLARGVAVAAVVAVLGTAGVASLTGHHPPGAPDAAAARVVAAARTHLGEPYEWGGEGPRSWDCSGLTYALWRDLGGVADIPRTSQAQAAWATPIADDDALPGDLVFFDDPVTHVSLYIGGGRVIDASSARRGVVVRDVWKSGVVRYGRVPRPGMPEGKSGTGRSVKAAATNPLSGSVRIRLNAVPRLESVSRLRPAPSALRMVRAARKTVGAPYQRRGGGPKYDAAGLVAASWRRAGGGLLPATAAALERRTRRVRVRDATPGDLVFYGRPAVHVGIYVGGGRMVDASRVLGKVVLRPVFRSETVRIGRLVPVAKRVATTTRAKAKAPRAPKPPRVAPRAKKAPRPRTRPRALR